MHPHHHNRIPTAATNTALGIAPSTEVVKQQEVRLQQELQHDQKEVVIIKPTKNDILCGKGRIGTLAPGNAIFRQVVELNRPLYYTCGKNEKYAVAEAIARALESQEVRFLVFSSHGRDRVWSVLPQERAVHKILRALRRKQQRQVPQAQSQTTMHNSSNNSRKLKQQQQQQGTTMLTTTMLNHSDSDGENNYFQQQQQQSHHHHHQGLPLVTIGQHHNNIMTDTIIADTINIGNTHEIINTNCWNRNNNNSSPNNNGSIQLQLYHSNFSSLPQQQQDSASSTTSSLSSSSSSSERNNNHVMKEDNEAINSGWETLLSKVKNNADIQIKKYHQEEQRKTMKMTATTTTTSNDDHLNVSQNSSFMMSQYVDINNNASDGTPSIDMEHSTNDGIMGVVKV